jgi:hypothetical protein
MKLDILKAIIIGWLVVNIPALTIMFFFILLGLKAFQPQWWAFVIVGFVVGWLWWSFTVPRWRRWAQEKGIDRDKLHRAALATGLVWPRGSFLEKTEFKIKE